MRTSQDTTSCSNCVPNLPKTRRRKSMIIIKEGKKEKWFEQGLSKKKKDNQSIEHLTDKCESSAGIKIMCVFMIIMNEYCYSIQNKTDFNWEEFF